MRILALFLTFAGLVIAADQPKQPKPTPREIPPDRREAVSQVMLKLQQAQIALQATQISAQQEIDKGRDVVRKYESEYVSLEDQLRKEFGGEGCKLTIEKSWQCTPVTPPVTSPQSNIKPDKPDNTITPATAPTPTTAPVTVPTTTPTPGKGKSQPQPQPQPQAKQPN